MKPPLFIVVLFFIASIATAQTLVTSPSTSTPPQMFVPDGQLLKAPVRIYVSPVNLDATANPRLQLAPFKDWKKTDATNLTKFPEYEPLLVASNQSWTEKVAGQSVQRHGTLLMFDLSNFEIARYKSTTRVAPVLTWQPSDWKPGSAKSMLVGQSVYLGSFWPAVWWTALTIIVLVAFIAQMAKKSKPSVLYLLSGPDNYLSLWRTQLAAWTIAVGSMVFLFGLIQLEVPRIPDSLVALMGLSVATGSLSAVADKSKARKNGGAGGATFAAAPEGASGAPEPAPKPRLYHLISNYDPSIQGVVLSIPKAQMVFWTGIILILFVLKSWLNGELWEVPWQLVTLTGISQAGYITDKAVENSKAAPIAPPQP